MAEAIDGETVVRRMSQGADGTLVVESSSGYDDTAWFGRVFRCVPARADWTDPVIRELHARYPGLWSLTDGSLFAGLVTSIVGQSISIASAMAVQRRLALTFQPGVDVDGRLMVPLPPAAHLADAPIALIRESGVTWKRAEGLKAVAREEVNGNLPAGDEADLGTIERELVKLPMVGPWTAASSLLWGIGATDAFPKGDVALLRAARLAYDRDSMTMRELDALAETWRPYRAIATRLLWTGLLGPGWE